MSLPTDIIFQSNTEPSGCHRGHKELSKSASSLRDLLPRSIQLSSYDNAVSTVSPAETHFASVNLLVVAKRLAATLSGANLNDRGLTSPPLVEMSVMRGTLSDSVSRMSVPTGVSRTPLRNSLCACKSPGHLCRGPFGHQLDQGLAGPPPVEMFIMRRTISDSMSRISVPTEGDCAPRRRRAVSDGVWNSKVYQHVMPDDEGGEWG